ncbi:MAG: D-alanyl-D-alanine carboxypeptidase/D-alanyl-D-alanine-endopeptidase [Bacteroidia bacterium]
MRLAVCALILLLVFADVSASAQDLETSIEEQGALLSYSFRDGSGKEIKSFNSKQLMMPASTNKVITCAAALHYLGEDFTYHTHLNAHGPINQGELAGSLVVLGMGDPSLGSGKAGAFTAEETLSKLVSMVTKAGINKISGDLIADVSLFRFDHTAVPRYWPFEDIGNYYGAGVYGLNWRSNEFKAAFKAGYQGSLVEAEILDFPLFDVDIESYVSTCEVDEEVIYMFGIPLEKTIRMDGCVPEGKVSTERGSIPNPPIQFLNEFKLALKAAGIELTGELKVSDTFYKTADGFTRLGEITSPPLKKLVFETNMRSNNLFAEAFAKYLGKLHGKGSRAEEGAEVILNYLKEELKLNVENIQLLDGSGLSPVNMISAGFQSEFMLRLKTTKDFGVIDESLPVSGKSGTMKSFGSLSGLKAKSGSMNGVKTYMGYLSSESHGILSFSLMVNHFTGKSSELKAEMIGFLKEMSN